MAKPKNKKKNRYSAKEMSSAWDDGYASGKTDGMDLGMNVMGEALLLSMVFFASRGYSLIVAEALPPSDAEGGNALAVSQSRDT